MVNITLGSGIVADKFIEGLKTNPKDVKVKLPQVGEVVLHIPPFFITPKKKGWKLLNPTTMVRNIATRKGTNSIDIKRDNVEHLQLEAHKKEVPSLCEFSPADQKKIIDYYKSVKEGRSEKFETKNKPRGRPVYLKKVKGQETPVEQLSTKDKRLIDTLKHKYSEFSTQLDKKSVNDKLKELNKYNKKRKTLPKQVVLGTSQEWGSVLKAFSEHGKGLKVDVTKLSDLNEQNDDDSEGQGGSILGKLGKMVKSKIDKVKDITTKVVYGSKSLPPRVEKLLGEVGDAVIQSADIGRTPVQAVITGIIKIVSSTPYEKLFHLFIILHTTKGDIRLEKNEVISMIKGGMPKDTESIKVSVPEGLTVKQLMDNTEKHMGNKFLTYASKGNNCQDFQMAILNSNHMNTPELTKFVKQDTEEIFKEPMFRKFANTVTDIAGRANVVLQGGNIKEYSKLLKHLESHITDPKEKIDKRDFTQSKELIDTIQQEKMKGGSLDYPDWEHMKWGSFTQQYKRFQEEHPDSHVQDLEDFAIMIIEDPTKYQKKTVKRARFYLNVIKKNKISKDTIMPKVKKSVEGGSVHEMPSSLDHPAHTSPHMSHVYHPGAMAIMHPMSASGMHVHHHHYHGHGLFAGSGVVEDARHLVGMGMWDWADPHKNGVAKAFSPGGGAEQFGKQVASTLIHKGIPLATQALASAGANALAPELGGVAGIVAGQAGKAGGQKLADMVGKETGYGLRPKKGSEEAKEWGRRMSEARKKKSVPDSEGEGFKRGTPEAHGHMAYVRQHKLKKGSEEAKSFMKMLREKRVKGKGVGPHSRSPVTDPSLL